jgi:hypothetical protein
VDPESRQVAQLHSALEGVQKVQEVYAKLWVEMRFEAAR